MLEVKRGVEELVADILVEFPSSPHEAMPGAEPGNGDPIHGTNGHYRRARIGEE